MTIVPPVFLQKLKEDFANSDEYHGYDPDDDPGYFQEFLVRIVYELSQERGAVE